MVDTTKPTVVVSADDTTLKAGQTATITFQFSEAVQNFANADVTVAGGTLNTIVQDGVDPTKYTATFTPTTVSDTFTGSIKVNANGYQDIANNAGTASNVLTFTGDTKSPVVTAKLLHDNGSLANDGVSNDITLTGAGDKNATVHFNVDGNDIVDTATASSTGAWTFSQLGITTDGPHTVIATETDAAGNTGTTTLNFTRDTEAPTVLSVGQNGGPYGPHHALILTLSLQNADHSAADVVIAGAPSISLSNGGKAVYSAADSDLHNGLVAFKYIPAANQNTADLQITTATFAAKAITDVAGNDASAGIAGQIAGTDLGAVVDTLNPSSVATLAHDTGASATDKITNDRGIVGTSDALATIVIKEGTTVVGSTTANGSGEWSFDPGGSLTETKHTYSVTATDTAGNISAASSLAFTYDVTAPTLVSAVSSAATVKSGGTITLTLNFSENAFIDAANPATISIGSHGTATYVSGSGTKALKYNYTPTAANEVSGDLQITGLAGNITDVAGNALVSAAKDIVFGTNGNVISTLAPAAIVSVDGDGAFKAAETVTIHLHFNENVTVTGAPQLKLSDGGIASYAAGSGGNDLSFTYTVGTHENANPLKIASVSLNGGTILDGSDVPANLTNLTNANLGVVIDTVTPTVTAKLLHDTGTLATDKVTSDATLTGTGEAGGDVAIFMDGSNTALGHTTVASNGTWTFVSSPADGVHSFTAIETDFSGNVSTPAALANVNLDTTAPAYQSFGVVGAGLDGKIATGETLNVVLHFDEALKFTGGAPKISLSDGQTLTYNAAGSNLANGDISFQTVIAAGASHNGALSLGAISGFPNSTFTDLAGNPINALTVNNLGPSGVTEDTVAPTAQSAVGSDADGDPNVAAGKLVTIVVAMSEVVNVIGTPTLKLSDGKVATYASGSGTDTLNFTFTVQSNETTNFTDLKVSSLTLPTGGSIKDVSGNAVTVATFNNLDTGIAIDGAAPAVTAVSIPAATPKALMSGDTVVITLAVKDVTTGGDQLFPAGNPTLQLSNGATAEFTSNTNTSLTFTYHVGSESTADLKVSGFNFDSTNKITDDAGNPVTLPSALASADLKLSTNVFTLKTAGASAWDNPNNWTPSASPSGPGAGSTAIVGSSGQIVNISGHDANVASLVTAKGAEVDASGVGLAITRDATNAGTIKLNGQDQIITLGTTNQSFALNNSGKISLLADGDGNATLELLGNTAATGAGTLALQSTGGKTASVVSDGTNDVTLTNGTATVAHTISGAGIIGDSHLQLTNEIKGIVNANSASDELLIDASAVTNNGTLEATNAGGLEIASAVTNNSLIQALGTNAKVTIESTITNTANKGTITASGTGAHVDLDNATIVGGKLTTVGTGVINIVGDSDLSVFDGTGAGNPVAIAGTVIDAGSGLKLLGTINNTGTMKFDGTSHAASAFLGGDVTLTGAGHVTFIGGTSVELSGLSSDRVLDNVANTISGSGRITSHVILHNEKSGIVGALTASDDFHIQQAALNNDGLVEAINGGALTFFSETISNSSTGVILASGNGSTLTLDHSAVDGSGAVNAASLGKVVISDTNFGANTTINNNGGEIDLNGASETLSGAVNNNTGMIEITNGTSGAFEGAVTNKATIDILDHASMFVSAATNTGTIHLAGGASLRSSSLTNSKTIVLDSGANSTAMFDVSLTNSGTITVNDGNVVYAGLNAGTTNINNTGTLAFNGTGSSASLYLANTVNLTGAGKITFADAANQSISTFTSASLTNGNATSGNTIQGAFDFNGGSGVSFDNTAKGIVSATFLGHALNINNFGGSAFHNEGTLQSSGWLKITNTTVDQSNATTGVIKTTAVNAHIDLDGATIQGGQLTTVAGSTVNFTNDITLTDVKATNAGTFHVDDTLHLAGTTTVAVSSGGHLVIDTATVDGGSPISIASGGFLDVVDQDSGLGPSLSVVTASITNAGSTTIDNTTLIEHGAITNTGTIAVKNTGNLRLDGDITGGALTIDATSYFAIEQSLTEDSTTIGSTINNAGSVTVHGHHDLTVAGAVTNTGTFSVADANLFFNSAVSGAGGISFDGAASVEFKAANSTSNVTFDYVEQQLVLDHSTTFHGTVTGFSGASNTTFSDFAAFGDSTIDNGWFPTAIANNDVNNETGSGAKNHFIQNSVDHGGEGYPVGSGLMNSEVLAGDFGIVLKPADSTGGGNNYAISGGLSWENPGGNSVNLISSGTGTDPGNSDSANGSPTGDGNLNKNPLLSSTVQQIENYLSEHAGVADSNALYLISSGGNDTTFANTLKSNGTAKPDYLAYLQDQAYALADEISDLQTAGAQTILVHGLSGDNGNGATTSGNFGSYFDTALFARLDADGVDYIRSDVYTLFNAMVAHSGNYGFTDSTVAKGTAGTAQTASAFIDLESTIATGWGQWGAPTGQMPKGLATDTTHSATGNYAYLRAPNAEYTSLYADDQHFSTQGQQFEANFDLGLLFSAGAVDMPSIDFGDVAYAIGTTTATYTGTSTGGTLTVVDAANHKATLSFAGDYRDYDFITVSDGHGGTDVIATTVSGAHDVIDNTGLNGVANVTAGMLGAEIVWTVGQNVTLTDEVTLTSAETIVSKGSAVTLTNSGTIDGGGAIGDSFMTLVNNASGVIDADDSHNGMLIQAKTFTNNGVIEATNNGWLDVTSIVGGNAQVGTGGLLEFGNASSAHVTFLDANGTLKLDVGATAATKFTGTISGFQNGDHINLADISYTTGDVQLSFNETTDKLTITDGTHSEVLTFGDGLTLASFHVTQDITHHVDLLHV